ncbi:MAG TPA: TonB family protein [Verrucomicrobiae bacterium]|nr:TonB family protein [Verrucomicrobiae bacterium]
MSSAATLRHDEGLKRFLYYSGGLHAFLVGLLIYGSFVTRTGDSWGGPGGSITVGVVGNVPAIPLPRPEIVSPSRVVDNTNGLYKTEPPPDIKTAPPPDAIPIPSFKLAKPQPEPRHRPAKISETPPPPPPQYKSRPSKLLENPVPPPPNAVPYGRGGTPTVPTSNFTMGDSKTPAGIGFPGVGGGDFGSRFPWYVQAVQQRISRNWLQSTIDPSVATAPRVIVTFDILRDGSVVNAQITQSSNNYSVDTSALRAVQNSSPLNPLPPGYNGSKVSVEFWFDFQRQ